MAPPDNDLVGLLGLAMAALGVPAALVVLVLVCRHAGRVLPRRRSRTTYWLGMAVLVPLALAACLLTPRALGDGAVIASFGWDAYAEGLRVVNKHGQLSDGRYLGVFWAAAFGAGWFPLWLLYGIPVAAWHCHFNPRRQPGQDAAAQEVERGRRGSGADRGTG